MLQVKGALVEAAPQPKTRVIIRRVMSFGAWKLVTFAAPAWAVLAACTITTDLNGLSSSSGGTSGTSGTSGSAGTSGTSGTTGGTSGTSGTGTSGTSGTSGTTSGNPGPRPGCVDKSATKRGSSAISAPGSFAFWMRPESALVADGNTAEAQIAPFFTPGNLVVKKFGFAIPPAAYIRGVGVAVKKRGSKNLRDGVVRLTLGSDPTGEDKKRPEVWPEELDVTQYGGAADRWGLPLTPPNVSTDAFGVAFNGRYDDAGNGLAEVDEIAITITYCE